MLQTAGTTHEVPASDHIGTCADGIHDQDKSVNETWGLLTIYHFLDIAMKKSILDIK
jgi:hypothetical protein